MSFSTKLQKNHQNQEKTPEPNFCCSVAVLQFSKGYFHTLKYFYIYI